MIGSDLTFYSLEDFYKRKEYIKEKYCKMDFDKKYIYKYYVYSRRILKDRICDLIWEFLNEYDEDELLFIEWKLNDEVSKYH